MLKQIAEVTGLRYSETDQLVRSMLQRIALKLPAGLVETDAAFEEEVLKAEKEITVEGCRALVSTYQAVTAPPPEKVLKIKSSPKGERIKVAAGNGVRYSFGPIWNASVIKGKGIAFVEANREKLNHQAIMLGIENPEEMDVSELAAQISPKVAV